MCQALKSSGLQPEDIDYINAHGTGTGNNDECEGIAMMRVFGDKMPPVSSTKSYTGHTTSAAGGVESVISILALNHGFIPANLGYETPIEGHNFKPVDHVIENVQLKHILTNSFGFGGNDSSCIFSAIENETPAHVSAAPQAGRQDCYIQSAAHISIQQPLTDDWFQNPIMPTQAYNESLEPDYSKYFSPMAARRMGRLLKRSMATAVEALGQHPVPDAIITGTGLGCIANTERFLSAMIDNQEDFLQPTYFMQSTHNTIGSQIAQHLKCHGYNCTYSHRGTSFDSSLMDAFIQMRAGAIHSALVGGHDEMTSEYFKMLSKIGYWKTGDVSPDVLKKADSQGSLSGSCSLNLLLTDQVDTDTLCKLVGMDMLYQPGVEALQAAADRLLQQAGISIQDLDAVVTGLSGDKDNDAVYRNFLRQYCPETPVVWYKHIFGESFCASAFGVYVGAECLRKKLMPSHLLYNASEGISNPKYILVHNHFQNKDHSLILLSL
jgi:3-oxoacyl-(acyl-carrier-protein) synthase